MACVEFPIEAPLILLCGHQYILPNFQNKKMKLKNIVSTGDARLA